MGYLKSCAAVPHAVLLLPPPPRGRPVRRVVFLGRLVWVFEPGGEQVGCRCELLDLSGPEGLRDRHIEGSRRVTGSADEFFSTDRFTVE
jgi:hypothetical protein